jgi:chromatin segregation and condensation protein Rec8/ScpA/Scc1 (kleisin family)
VKFGDVVGHSSRLAAAGAFAGLMQLASQGLVRCRQPAPYAELEVEVALPAAAGGKVRRLTA